MTKQSSHYYSITAASDAIDVPKHVIRFWETKFPMIKPMKNNSGRRYYRNNDIELLKAIKYLTHDQGYSIKGLNKLIKNHSQQQVIDLAQEFRNNGTQLPESLQIVPSIDDTSITNNDSHHANFTAIISYIEQILELDAQHETPS